MQAQVQCGNVGMIKDECFMVSVISVNVYKDKRCS